MKYTEDLKKKVFDLLSSGEYTQKEVCRIVKISEDTFITWKNEKTEFSDLVKEANEIAYQKRLAEIKALAMGGLRRLVAGEEYDELHEEFELDKDNKPVKIFEKRVKKVVQPNVTAVMYALNNTDGDNWKHKEHKKIEAEVEITKPIEELSDAELTEIATRSKQPVQSEEADNIGE